MKRFLVVYSTQWEVVDTQRNCEVVLTDPDRIVITQLADDMNSREAIQLVAL